MTETSHGERVRLRILEMGLRLWLIDSTYVSARRIAGELNMTHGAVLHHFRNYEGGLLDAVAFHAIKQGESRIVAQLIAQRHRLVAHMSDDDKRSHMQAAI